MFLVELSHNTIKSEIEELNLKSKRKVIYINNKML